jgi:hypothetical protein
VQPEDLRNGSVFGRFYWSARMCQVKKHRREGLREAQSPTGVRRFGGNTECLEKEARRRSLTPADSTV